MSTDEGRSQLTEVERAYIEWFRSTAVPRSSSGTKMEAFAAGWDARGPDLRVSFCWGLRDDQWWLVEYHDGEPHAAYHQDHGRIVAQRDTFSRWTKGAASKSPPCSGATLPESETT